MHFFTDFEARLRSTIVPLWKPSDLTVQNSKIFNLLFSLDAIAAFIFDVPKSRIEIINF